MAEIRSGLTATTIDVPETLRWVEDPSCGAIASFLGTVRESPAVSGNSGKEVTGLSYEAHEALAGERLRSICTEAAGRWDLVKVAAYHRTGHCPLGEVTVVIACSSPHRREALDACAWLIDTIKASVPIFKKEMYSDGSDWVGAEGA